MLETRIFEARFFLSMNRGESTATPNIVFSVGYYLELHNVVSFCFYKRGFLTSPDVVVL